MDNLIYRREAIDAINKKNVLIDLDNYLVEIVKNGKRHSLIEFIEERINDVLDLRMRDDGEADRDAEIVRCKDCKYCEEGTFIELKVLRCKQVNGRAVDYNWFCADGARRSEND